MFYRNHTKEILVMAVAALFVMALAYSALGDMPAGYAGSFAGKVTAIDSGKKIVTVKSAAGDEKKFTLSEKGQVLRCDKAAAWETIKVGDEVTISYFEKTAGDYVAETLTLSPGMEKC